MVSKFLQKIQLDNNVIALYNSLYLKVVFVDENEYKDIISEKVDESLKEVLINNYIYVNSEDDEIRWNKLVEVNHSFDGKVDVLYLILTTDCNLRCEYCMVKSGGYKREYMSVEVLDKTLSMYSDYLKRNDLSGKIIFYGGEPIIDKGKLFYAVEKIHSLDAEINLEIVTNGLLLDDEMVDFISNNNISISVSIDGPQIINDENRKKINGEGSYTEIINAIDILKRKKVKYGISMCCSSQFIEHLDDIEKWILETKIGENFSINLYHHNGYRKDWKEFSERQAEVLMRLYSFFNKNGYFEQRMGRRVRAFFQNEPIFSDCASSGENQLVVFPSGQVGVCHVIRDNMILPNVKNVSTLEEIIDEPVLADWREKTVYRNECCKECSCLFLCGGGCIAQKNALEMQQMDESFCIYMKEFIKWLLKTVYEEYGKNDKC